MVNTLLDFAALHSHRLHNYSSLQTRRLPGSIKNALKLGVCSEWAVLNATNTENVMIIMDQAGIANNVDNYHYFVK